ncbi:uncharacterized protein [Nicotiana tomentosiformis]|uniref:uncharacterized protein n=1 Tax=Nicotiana tomentosiformis TaxID=4098 RepID=UPI00388C672F
MPIVIIGLQEALAQILTVCIGLAQLVLAQATPATSQAGGGTHTPVARTPEQVVQGLQIAGALPVQSVAVAEAQVGSIMNNEEQKRLERFGRLHPPSFSGTKSEDALDFLDRCQWIVRTSGILETSGVSFTTFQLIVAAFRWWETYERSRPVGAAPLTWHAFSELFLEKFVPQTRSEKLCRKFDYLRQEDLSVT